MKIARRWSAPLLMICALTSTTSLQAFTYQTLFGSSANPVLSPVAVAPTAGLWWSPGQNGQFMQVHIGPGGYALLTLTDSAADGQPRYRVMQGELQFEDAALPLQAVAQVQSKLYEVQDSGCLECGAGAGQTRVLDARNWVVRFRDGAHAELLGPTGLVRSYEVFPLYNKAADSPQQRFQGLQLLLSVWVSGALRHEQVSLREVSVDARCGEAALLVAKEFELEFADPARSSDVAQLMAGTRLQFGTGANPLIRLKGFVPEYATTCTRVQCTGELFLTGRQLCRNLYAMHDSGAMLRGAALPDAGAGFNASAQTPFGDVRYVGGLSLQVLPRN